MRSIGRFACALDIDGVLVRGNKPIKGALESIKLLQSHRIPFVCLTNGGGVLEKVKSERLSWILTKETNAPTSNLLSANQMILSHSPMQHLVHKYENRDVLIVGGGDQESLMEVVRAYGFKRAIHIADYVYQNPNLYPSFPVENRLNLSEEEWQERINRDRISTDHRFDAIMVFYDSDHVGRDVQVIIDIMRSKGVPGQEIHLPSSDNQFEHHVKLYMSHEDFLYSSNFAWPRFGQGFFKMTLEHIYKNLTGHDLKITMFGKPNRASYKFAENRLQQINREMYGEESISLFYGVGDNPMSDIAGANAAGDHWKSVLVRTGVFHDPTLSNDTTHPADFVLNDVYEFVSKLIANEL